MKEYLIIPASIIISLKEGSTGTWYVESPMIKGLLATGRTQEEAITNMTLAMARISRAHLEEEAKT